ncbi:MAG: hypothetical protein IJF29_02670 [Firmicutes bacterium]|nr:hypothetical protein [Bacillota bacterium]
MKVKDMINRVMGLFDEITGNDVIKDAEEYRYRIYEAMDSIQRELAVILSPITDVKTIISIDGHADTGSDVLRIRTLKDKNGRDVYFSCGVMNEIIVADGEYELYYEKNPSCISELGVNSTITNDKELEISPEAQEAMVYGVCAYLLMNDEPELYNAYMSRYMSLISNILAARDSRASALARGGVYI